MWLCDYVFRNSTLGLQIKPDFLNEIKRFFLSRVVELLIF